MSDEDEAPTRPWRAMVLCPACHGDGGQLQEIRSSITYRAIRRECLVCKGKGRVTRVVAARWEKLLKDD